MQSVVSWGIKGPEGVEEAEGVEDVKDTCRYLRYAETSFLRGTLCLCERYAFARDLSYSRMYIKTEKPQLHAEASVIGVATTYFPTS